jgi:hypothetical protein
MAVQQQGFTVIHGEGFEHPVSILKAAVSNRDLR